jgi:hypothetical protein
MKQRVRRSCVIFEECMLSVRRLEDCWLGVGVVKSEEWSDRVKGILIETAELLVSVIFAWLESVERFLDGKVKLSMAAFAFYTYLRLRFKAVNSTH